VCVACVAFGCYATEVKRALHHASVGVVMLSSWSCFYFLPTQFAPRVAAHHRVHNCVRWAACACVARAGAGAVRSPMIEAWARKFRGACAQELQITCVRAISFAPSI